MSSSAYSLSKSLEIDRISCQIFISQHLKANEFNKINSLSEEDKSNLINVFEYYLGGSIPVDSKYLAKLKKEISKEYSTAEKKQEIRSYTLAIMSNFLEILKGRHKKAPPYDDNVKNALTKDMQQYFDRSKVKASTNLT